MYKLPAILLLARITIMVPYDSTRINPNIYILCAGARCKCNYMHKSEDIQLCNMFHWST